MRIKCVIYIILPYKTSNLNWPRESSASSLTESTATTKDTKGCIERAAQDVVVVAKLKVNGPDDAGNGYYRGCMCKTTARIRLRLQC